MHTFLVAGRRQQLMVTSLPSYDIGNDISGDFFAPPFSLTHRPPSPSPPPHTPGPLTFLPGELWGNFIGKGDLASQRAVSLKF